MAGNRKSPRLSSTVKAKRAASRTATVPTVNFVNPSEELAKLHLLAMHSLNRMIDSTGNFSDWMNVLHRITVGSYMLDSYFKPSQGAQIAFNNAWMAVVLIKLRTHQTGTFGVMVKELDSITLALSLTDQFSRQMTAKEIHHIYKDTEAYYDELVRINQQSYPPNWREEQAKADMVKQLSIEFAAAVTGPTNTVPMLEAA